VSAKKKNIVWDTVVPLERRPARTALAEIRRALKPWLAETWKRLNQVYQRDSQYSPSMARISTSQAGLESYRAWCEARQLDPLKPQHATVYFGVGGVCVDTSGPAHGSPYQARQLLGCDGSAKRSEVSLGRDHGLALDELSESHFFRARLYSEERRSRWEGRLKLRFWLPTFELHPPEAVITKHNGLVWADAEAVSSTEIRLRARNVWVPLRKLIVAAVRVSSQELRFERDLDQKLVIESPFKAPPIRKSAKKRLKWRSRRW